MESAQIGQEKGDKKDKGGEAIEMQTFQSISTWVEAAEAMEAADPNEKP